MAINRFDCLEFGFENIWLHSLFENLYFTGVALRDSPIGLAAYILEKFSTWTNSDWRKLEDGGLQLKYDMADLLDNVMIYWVTASITSSMRLYSETFNKNHYNVGLER